MERIIEYILRFGNLNKHQTDFILSKATRLDLRKDEFFLEAGKVPMQGGFILKGVIRFCYYNNNGDETTHFFIDENNFVTDYQKFETQAPASEYAQAETIERRGPLVSEDTTTRYLSFMQKFPFLVNRIPLSYVGSYLGITQQSLSRIRKISGKWLLSFGKRFLLS